MSRLPVDKLDTGYDDDVPCMVWVAATNQKGYGIWGEESAHRRMYRMVYGEPFDGWTVHHRCRVRPCVEPRHLVALPPDEHNQRQIEDRIRDIDRTRARVRFTTPRWATWAP